MSQNYHESEFPKLNKVDFQIENNSLDMSGNRRSNNNLKFELVGQIYA